MRSLAISLVFVCAFLGACRAVPPRPADMSPVVDRIAEFCKDEAAACTHEIEESLKELPKCQRYVECRQVAERTGIR